jgi:hypothetical protein
MRLISLAALMVAPISISDQAGNKPKMVAKAFGRRLLGAELTEFQAG